MYETVVSAPGKVILHGEHSVVYGKVAVASSLDLRCYLRLVPNTDGCITLDLPNVDIHEQWTVDSLQNNLISKICEKDGCSEPLPPSEEVLQILKQFVGIGNEDSGTKTLAVITSLYLCSRILADAQHPLPAFKIRLISQQPVGAGLGSSAAFCVCLAAVLLQSAGKIRNLTDVQSSSDGSGDVKVSGYTDTERTLTLSGSAFRLHTTDDVGPTGPILFKEGNR